MTAIVTGLFGVITGHLVARSYLRHHRATLPSAAMVIGATAVLVFAGAFVIVWFLQHMMIG